MKKLGYHRLQLSDGQIIQGPLVVTIDDNSNLIEYHLLHGEEAMVEWVGGTFVVNLLDGGL